MNTFFDTRKPFYGDIHNHCGISYGHGGLSDALANARLQLDFCSITGHSSWADMPRDDARLAEIVRYHNEGFARLDRDWFSVLDTVEQANRPGHFITFPSYEWHSCRYGDHVFYFSAADDAKRMIKPADMPEAAAAIRRERSAGRDCFLAPHHIGYKTGFRGLDWTSFDGEISPLVEIVSMHGGAESDDCPVPYLHTMGPRDSRNTMQAGLRQGHRFGVIGSTDHHSAHPGSYGYGRTGVWAPELTRKAIWRALRERRTWALTGDRIDLAFSVDGTPLGGVTSGNDTPLVQLRVRGGYQLDRIELIGNGQVIRQENFLPAARKQTPDPKTGMRRKMNGEMRGKIRGKVVFEVGWGEKGKVQEWDAAIEVLNGCLLNAEPRFHGLDVVDPLDGARPEYRFSAFEAPADNVVRFRTRTRGCVNTRTDGNQALCLEVEGDEATLLQAEFNGKRFVWPLGSLLDGALTEFLDGFVSAAVRVSRFIPEREYYVEREWRVSATDLFSDNRITDGASPGFDYLYLRVSQSNGQYAWSSPVFFDTV